MKKAIIYLIFTTFFYIGCKNEPTKPEETPPGYQQDIPWPSLADSPWPMNHHDPQSTGRSQFSGPRSGELIGHVPTGELQNSLVIGHNKRVYFSPTRDTASGIYSSDYQGSIKWKAGSKTREIFTTPLIGRNGRIYYYQGYNLPGIQDFFLKAMNSNGLEEWKLKLNGKVNIRGLNVGIDGTIYIIDTGQYLRAISNDGTEIWSYHDSRFDPNYWSALTFSPDGNTVYIQGMGATLIAFNIETKEIKWTWGTTHLFNNPLVDVQGNIYLFPIPEQDEFKKGKFFSITPNGEIRWVFTFPSGFDSYSSYPEYLHLDPTMDKEGNLYFGQDTIYSVNFEGKLRWKYPLGRDRQNHCPLVCDKDGVVYAGLASREVIAINKSGELVWKLQLDERRELGASPAISENGLLMFPSFRSESIYIIK